MYYVKANIGNCITSLLLRQSWHLKPPSPDDVKPNILSFQLTFLKEKQGKPTHW